MEFQVQGKTDDYVRLQKDGVGIEFLGLKYAGCLCIKTK